jgi:hypothetical protein
VAASYHDKHGETSICGSQWRNGAIIIIMAWRRKSAINGGSENQ